MGVGQECMVAEAEAKVWHAAAVDRGRESGTLMLSWKDLKEIPPETFGLAELRELKIGNVMCIVCGGLGRCQPQRAVCSRSGQRYQVHSGAVAGVDCSRGAALSQESDKARCRGCFSPTDTPSVCQSGGQQAEDGAEVVAISL